MNRNIKIALLVAAGLAAVVSGLFYATKNGVLAIAKPAPEPPKNEQPFPTVEVVKVPTVMVEQEPTPSENDDGGEIIGPMATIFRVKSDAKSLDQDGLSKKENV